ncbi:MAG: LysR substrate-binding domain-containing protein [Pseudomonadota bacterium]
MNFRDLEYVIETAKALSFSKAAENCNVSQPSLSAQIKKLEEELGTNLFIRSKRKVLLSAYGESFLEKAQQILKTRGEMYLLANENKNPLQGKVNLGAILTVAPYMFPNIVSVLSKKAPKIQLTLKEAKTEELLKSLLDGKIDAAILSLPTDDHVFESQSLFYEPFYVAVAKNHKLASKKTITPKDMDAQKLILLEEGHCFRAQALDVCHSTAAKENKIFKATSLETIRHFIEAGDGVTLMPEMSIQKDDGLAYIPLEDKKFMRQIGIVWRKSCNKKPQIEKLISLIKP